MANLEDVMSEEEVQNMVDEACGRQEEGCSGEISKQVLKRETVTHGDAGAEEGERSHLGSGVGVKNDYLGEQPLPHEMSMSTGNPCSDYMTAEELSTAGEGVVKDKELDLEIFEVDNAGEQQLHQLSLLGLAIKGGHLSTMNALIAHGVDVDAPVCVKDSHHLSPLLYAAGLSR